MSYYTGKLIESTVYCMSNKIYAVFLMISCLNFCSYVDSSFFCLNSLSKIKVYNIMYQTCVKNFEPRKKTKLLHIHDIIQGESKVIDNI